MTTSTAHPKSLSNGTGKSNGPAHPIIQRLHQSLSAPRAPPARASPFHAVTHGNASQAAHPNAAVASNIRAALAKTPHPIRHA